MANETLPKTFAESLPGDVKDVEGLDDSIEPNSWKHYPLDDILVRHEQRTISDIVRRINRKVYILDPDFQRDFVWDENRQSRLIESALMRIPLPVFYLAEQSDGRIVVVDGLQRLTTFHRYLSNEFALQNLETSEINGKRFSDLPMKYQNRIEDTNLVLYLIDAKVPEQIKLDIFERVNSGLPLTRQQMRNCIYVGKATRWLRQQAQSEEFLRATGGSLNAKTMRDREVINRFCAFRILGVKSYRGDMDQFLAETLKRMNNMSEEELDALASAFRTSMVNNYAVFAQHAFRRHLSLDSGRSVINVALFDVFSTLLADYETEAIVDQAEDIREGFYELLTSGLLPPAITLGTNQVNRVRDRFALIEDMLEAKAPATFYRDYEDAL
jgi:hypothetical protein